MPQGDVRFDSFLELLMDVPSVGSLVSLDVPGFSLEKILRVVLDLIRCAT